MAQDSYVSTQNTPSSYLVGDRHPDDRDPPAISGQIPPGAATLRAMDPGGGENSQAGSPAQSSAQTSTHDPIDVADESTEQEQKIRAIPLICHVCPSKPRFSDLSHLLTHLNSKSHLAQKHQLKLESYADPEARSILNEFKDWKHTHNIDVLLAERYAEKKRKGNGPPAPVLPNTNLRGSSRSGSVASSIRSRSNIGQGLVPQVPDGSQSILPFPGVKDEPVDDFNLRQPIPVVPAPQRSWMSSQLGGPNPVVDVVNGQTFGSYQSMEPMAPTSHVVAHARAEPGNRSFLVESSPAIDETGSVLGVAEDAMDVVESKEGGEPKLKGAVWPGMGIFDSATNEQKRRRNQRKNPQVLHAMQRYSGMVQPIYTRWKIVGDIWDQDAVRGIEDAPSEVDTEYDSGGECASVTKPTAKKRRSPNWRLKNDSSPNERFIPAGNTITPPSNGDEYTIANFSLPDHRQHGSHGIANETPQTNRIGVPVFSTPNMKLEHSSNSFFLTDRAASPLESYGGPPRMGYAHGLQPFARQAQFGMSAQNLRAFSSLGSPTPSGQNHLRHFHGTTPTILARSMTAANGFFPGHGANPSTPVSSAHLAQARTFEYGSALSQQDETPKSFHANGFHTNGLGSPAFQTPNRPQTGYQPHGLPCQNFHENGPSINDHNGNATPHSIHPGGLDGNSVQPSDIESGSIPQSDLSADSSLQAVSPSQTFNDISQTDGIYPSPVTIGNGHPL